MSTANSNNPNQSAQVAVEYVATQVDKTRAAFRRTRAVAIASIVFVAGYMIVVTYIIRNHLLQPKPAAEFATHYVSNFVQENGQELSQQMLHEVPALVHKLPDMAIDQMPKARVHFEKQVESVVTKFGQDLAPQVAQDIDRFLVDHQQEIKEFLEASQDPALVAALGDRLEYELRDMLNTPDETGRSAMDHLNDHLEALRLVQARLHRLATAPDLNPQEKQLRRSIASLLSAIQQRA